MIRNFPGLAVFTITTALLTFGTAAAFGEAPTYMTGGPLAGIELPLYPTYEGDAPGSPGGSLGLQSDLYPGSVEHFRSIGYKYMPVRSFFDAQSQLKNWVAPALPGAPAAKVEQYAQPIWNVPRFAPSSPTGKFEPPVPVLRLDAGDTIVDASLGELKPGMYAVRVIAAVPPEQNFNYRRDLFYTLAVNDQVGGGITTYRVRAGYNDQFYATAEIYFNAPEARSYHAKLAVGKDSKIQVLVHNVSFDDALVGIERKAFKTKSINPLDQAMIDVYTAHEANWKSDAQTRKERFERDEAIWNGFPNPNKNWVFWLSPTAQFKLTNDVRPGYDGKTREQLEEIHGKWVSTLQGEWGNIPTADLRVIMRNEKLNLNWTADDMNANRPLPGPLPDDGTGLSQPDPDAKDTGWCYIPVAAVMMNRLQSYQTQFTRSGDLIRLYGPNAMRDSLVAFARFVYGYPALATNQDLGAMIRNVGPFNLEMFDRRRHLRPQYLSWYTNCTTQLQVYDQLFPLISQDQTLADSIGRFIPWVKTPKDVVALFDSYLVQQTAKRIMRYHYSVEATAISQAAAVLGDREKTTPWMEWQFSKTFMYPMPPAGIQHLVIVETDRSGQEKVGSSYYAPGKSASVQAHSLEMYTQAMGPTQFDMLNFDNYPKVLRSLYWPIDMIYAANQYPRTGDVSGPGSTGLSFLTAAYNMQAFDSGWKWTKDPQFAAVLSLLSSAKSYSPEAWAEIQAAAANVKRLPWMDNRSRVVPDWAAILETGQQSDDFRDRSGVTLRTGRGWGHHHHDTLDLQLSAYGLPLILDAGQRPSYTKPPSRASYLHNLVTVDGKNGFDYTWIRNVSDNPGVQYLLAQAGEPAGNIQTVRQTALIDVAEAKDLKPLKLSEQFSGGMIRKDKHDAASYVIDVVRTPPPGKVHRYNFHAMINDQFEWNASDITKLGKDFQGGSYSVYPDMNEAGIAPQNFQATWRMRRETTPTNRQGVEKNFLGRNFDPQSPAKFIRLHLLDVQGLAVDRAEAAMIKSPGESHWTVIGVSAKDEAKKGNVFAGIIEPYMGTPIIASAKLLNITDNEDNWQRAVAYTIKTVHGHNDLVFADGLPEKQRQVGEVKLAAQFATLSQDAQGLRMASITGGTLLDSALVKIKVSTAKHTGTITAVNYLKRQITLDTLWPERSSRLVVEVGGANRMTHYNLTAINNPTSSASGESSVSGSTLTTLSGADFYYAAIEAINPANGTVTGSLPLAPAPAIGETKDYTASNAAGTKFWRANISGANLFYLKGEHPVNDAAFAPEKAIRLWEYGVGDTVVQTTSVSIKRQDAATYQLRATADATFQLRGISAQVSMDEGKTWRSAGRAGDSNGWIAIDVLAADATDHVVLVRIQ